MSEKSATHHAGQDDQSSAGNLPHMLSRIWNYAGAGLGWVGANIVKIVVALGTIFLLGLLVNQVAKSSVTIEDISVPKNLSDQGLTPQIMAHELRDAMAQVKSSALADYVVTSLDKTKAAKRFDLSDEIPDPTVPETGISVSALASYLRDVLGLERTRISGELVEIHTHMGKQYSLRLRVNDALLPVDNPATEENLQDAIKSGGERIEQKLEPVTYASYMYYSKSDTITALDTLLSYLAQDNPANAGNGVTYAEAYDLWCQILSDRYDYPAALRKCQKAEDYDPDDYWTYVTTGGVDEAAKDYQAAIVKYRAADPKDDEDGWAREDLAHVQTLVHDYKGALATLESALYPRPRCIPKVCSLLYNMLGTLYESVNTDAGRSKAVDAYESAIAADEHNKEPYEHLAGLMIMRHNPVEAGELYGTIGEILWYDGSYKDAEFPLARASALSTSRMSYYWTGLYGLVLDTNGEHAQAVSAFDTAILRAKPQFPILPSWLDNDQAVALMHQSSAAPGSAEAVEELKRGCGLVQAAAPTATGSGRQDLIDTAGQIDKSFAGAGSCQIQ
jgi:tetratricopeptide (TPR) repeat protein